MTTLMCSSGRGCNKLVPSNGAKNLMCGFCTINLDKCTCYGYFSDHLLWAEFDLVGWPNLLKPNKPKVEFVRTRLHVAKAQA